MAGADGSVRYRLDGWVMTEIGPTACAQGHPLVVGSHTVGWDGAYRTYSCNECWDEHIRCLQAGKPGVQHTLRYVCDYRLGVEVEWKNRPPGARPA
jgi:hypothetical protein